MNPSDQVLLRQYASRRDAEAFTRIVRRYAGMVFGSCLRVTRNAHDAEDAAQECFLELARHAGSITTSLPGWLHTTATNQALMALRKAATRERHEKQREVVSQPERPWDEIAPLVDHALEQLSETERLPLVLHFLQGKTQEEVAVELDVSQPTVSRRIEKGVELLRDRLKISGVIVPVAIVGTLLGQNAATAAPATLTAVLGKMALAGVGGAAESVAAAGTAATGGIGIMKLSLIGLAAAAAVTSAVVVTRVGGQEGAKSEPSPPAVVEEQSAKEQAAPVEMVTYKGVVLDPAGEPVEGVHVRSDIPHQNRRKWLVGEAETVTDEKGRFALGPLSGVNQPGRYRQLIFQHPRYAIAWFTHRRDSAGLPDLANIIVSLTESAPVTGIVRDEAGNPVAGATVAADLQGVMHTADFLELLTADGLAVQTDEEGRFRLEVAPRKSRLRLIVRCPQFATWTTEDIIGVRWTHFGKIDWPSMGYPVRAGNKDINITLKRACIVKGRLLLDGAPFRQSGILIAENRSFAEPAMTDDEGHFALAGLAEGDCTICMNIDDMKRLGITGLPVSLHKSLAESPVTVDFPVVTGTLISGQLLDQNTGLPVPDNDILAEFRRNDGDLITIDSAATDTAGCFTLRLPEGSFVLSTHGWDAEYYFLRPEEKEVNVIAGEQPEPLVWRILTCPQITGRLTDVHGKPIKGRVRVSWLSESLHTDENGRFAFPRPNGRGPFGGLAISEDMRLGCGFSLEPEDDRLDLTLEPVGTVTGSVVDQNERPVENADIGLLALSPRLRDLLERDPICQIVRQPESRFKIDRVPPHLKVTLRIEAPVRPGRPLSHAQREIEEIEPGGVVDAGTAILQVPDDDAPLWDAKLSGRVTDQNGAPVIDALVTARPASLGCQDRTDIEGKFYLEGLPPHVTVAVQEPTLPTIFFKDIRTGQDDLELQINLQQQDENR